MIEGSPPAGKTWMTLEVDIARWSPSHETYVGLPVVAVQHAPVAKDKLDGLFATLADDLNEAVNNLSAGRTTYARQQSSLATALGTLSRTVDELANRYREGESL